jgi:hypothetical protein
MPADQRAIPIRLYLHTDLAVASVAVASVLMSYLLHLAPSQLSRAGNPLWYAEKPGLLPRQLDFGKIYYTTCDEWIVAKWVLLVVCTLWVTWHHRT